MKPTQLDFDDLCTEIRRLAPRQVVQDVPLSIFPPVRVVLSYLIHAQLSPAAPLQKPRLPLREVRLCARSQIVQV